MKFLEEYGFSKDEVTVIEKKVPTLLKNKIKEHKNIVSQNIAFLKELEIPNYKEIFTKYYDMFLMDVTNFQDIFTKYDKEDLIEKLVKNIAIIEHL